MDKKSLDQILIVIGEMTEKDDLKEVYEAYRNRSRELRERETLDAKMTFRKGQKVSFKHKGFKYSGVIEKKNEKRAKVSVKETDHPFGDQYKGNWNVPYTALQAAD